MKVYLTLTHKHLRIKRFKTVGLTLVFILSIFQLFSQEQKANDYFSISSYGRVGVNWSFENGGSIGRRLNLNNMGSIGGRMEEQDYLEVAPSFHFTPSKKSDSTVISANLRFAFYSQSLSYFANSTSSSFGGLTMGMPEIYVEAKNISGKDVNIWIGARFYQRQDLHIADHFYFSDHSGQGAGIEYKKTRLASIFVSSNDTSSTLPPYFYLNYISGTPQVALRQRNVFILEQDLSLSQNHEITLLGEYHYMPNHTDEDLEVPDSLDIVLDYGSDYGVVFGVRLASEFNNFMKGASNKLAVRYGNRLANGGDGGVSQTWLTYGAPDLETKNYNGAYSLSIVNDFFVNTSKRNSLNAYIVLTHSKGAAASDSTAKTYLGKEIVNKKTDFTIGMRNAYYINDKFHLLGEVHYSQRQDGVLPTYSMLKFSLAPTLVPTGGKDYWIRPHLRFVTSVARYNDAAMNDLYSPYLGFIGAKRWGYYLGFKAEWWI